MMIDFEKRAKKELGKITAKEEREDAFIFFNDDLDYDGVVVFLKSNGKRLTMSQYAMRKVGDPNAKGRRTDDR